jgi:hypothetical protein
MKKEEKIKVEVEKTLCAFDKIEEIEGNPYLFTKIQFAIENQQIKENRFFFKANILMPIILFLVVIGNLVTAVFFLSNKNETTATKQTYLSAISSEYSISHSYYTELNKMVGN